MKVNSKLQVRIKKESRMRRIQRKAKQRNMTVRAFIKSIVDSWTDRMVALKNATTHTSAREIASNLGY